MIGSYQVTGVADFAKKMDEEGGTVKKAPVNTRRSQNACDYLGFVSATSYGTGFQACSPTSLDGN